MYHDRSLTPTVAVACREAMWTSNPAKLARHPKPHHYIALHPSALLPLAFFLLPSFDLLIASRALLVFVCGARLRHYRPTIAILEPELHFTFIS